MPFVAECILCGQKVRLPDRASGASVQCPRCKSYFTAAAEDDRLPANPHHIASIAAQAKTDTPLAPTTRPVPPPADDDPADAPPSDPELSETPSAAASEAPARASVSAFAPSPFDRPARVSWKLPPIDPVGLASLLLAGAALLCASFAWWLYELTWLVLPLVVIGLLVGGVGIVRGMMAPKRRFVLAALGAALSLVLLVIALAFPTLLGPIYGLSRQSGPADSARPKPVPHAHVPPDTEPEDPEWPDASMFSMKFGTVRVEVVHATLRPVEFTDRGQKKKTKESYLVVRVRAHQPAGSKEFTREDWAIADGEKERPRPTLTDLNGRPIGQPAIGKEAGEAAQKSYMFPIGITDEIYVFDAPPGGTLKLEIPAETWDSKGSIRFSIPPRMIRTDLDPGPGVKKDK